MITSWDPGGITGWCAWTDEGKYIKEGQVELDKLPEFYIELENELKDEHGKNTLVIVEDFRLFLKRAQRQAGSNMPASQGIGMLKSGAAFSGARLEIQPSSILPTAEKWSGRKLPSDHSISHSAAAFLHGFFFLHKNGMIPSALELIKEHGGSAG